jgi:hypothetical protein
MTFCPPDESVQECETRCQLIESDLEGETHRGRLALSSRIFIGEESADAVAVTRDGLGKLAQRCPSCFTQPREFRGMRRPHACAGEAFAIQSSHQRNLSLKSGEMHPSESH